MNMISYYFTRTVDWVSFRTFKRYNRVNISTLRPNYWDKDTIMLHAVMQLIVDYVEIELASLEYNRNTASFKERLHHYLPWFIRPSFLIRSRERGLSHIEYIKSFDGKDDDSGPLREQINSMKTLESIYLWWKDVYPNRIDPDVLSGFNLDYFDESKGMEAIEIESKY